MIRRWVRPIRQIGFAPWLEMEAARRLLLPRVKRLPPIPVPEAGSPEVHMLLSRSRLLEGMWAIYSLLGLSRRSLPITIHDDGSLAEGDVRQLERALPGVRVVDRRSADTTMRELLRSSGLLRCLELRERLVFALKLFDACEIARSESIVLLDSDVLFFRDAVELLDPNWGPEHAFQRDYSRSYCLAVEEMSKLEGAFPAAQLNPGIMRISRKLVDFRRIERYLQVPGFFDGEGHPSYFAELTLWALEVSHNANRELPETYGIGTSPWVMPEAVAGHFCGGGFWGSTFYSKGIAALARRDWRELAG